MTATNRPILSVLLSLLLVMSGPALAISEIVGGQAGFAMVDCGSMLMAQEESASSEPETENKCAIAPDMVCLSAGGFGTCGVSVGLLLAGPTGLNNIGCQPVLVAHAAIYQNPFLASVTPPPLYRS